MEDAEQEAHLNEKVEASDAQSPIVVDDDQLVERKEEFQSFNYTLFFNVDVEKEYKSENVVNNVALVATSFSSSQRQNNIPHIRAKKCKMRHLLLGSFIFIPPPLERKRTLDTKLRVKFISSKWREK